MDPKVTRRRFLRATAGGAALAALGGAPGCGPTPRTWEAASSAPAGRTWRFRSRPDLHPPVIRVDTSSPDTAPGYVFVAPKNGPGESGPWQHGCVILDNEGQPVWLHLLADESLDVMNFEVQEYGGETVLTWWVGHHAGYGRGCYVIADHSYEQIKKVRVGNGCRGDHHEFLITPEDTALFTVFDTVHRDLSSVGGPVNGAVFEGIVQEVDIETGKVLFEWHSLDHVELSRPRSRPYDHLHINSVDVWDKDHLLISSRATSTLFKVDRNTGEIAWRLGGEKSDFEMGEGARFAFQHDARRHPDGTVSVFDNGRLSTVAQSRGIVLEVDEDAMRATLAREYTHPEKVRSGTQGNVQLLPDGDAFVGWGSAPVLSEFSRDGGLLFNASFPPQGESYRAFRFPWKGHPQEAPAIAAEPGPGDEVKVYASWNGATEVATWQVLAGSGAGDLKPLASAPRKGFETVMTGKTTEPYVGVKALDASGKVLGTSRAIKPEKSA